MQLTPGHKINEYWRGSLLSSCALNLLLLAVVQLPVKLCLCHVLVLLGLSYYKVIKVNWNL